MSGDEEFDECPMGCGRTTDDVAGGPCSACWDEVPSDPDEAVDDAQRRVMETWS